LLVIGAVVVGGGILIAAMLKDDEWAGASGGSRRVMGLASASSGLGPKGIETLSRIRDAAFSFVFEKAVDTSTKCFRGSENTTSEGKRPREQPHLLQVQIPIHAVDRERGTERDTARNARNSSSIG
jgi:hypothetical protein